MSVTEDYLIGYQHGYERGLAEGRSEVRREIQQLKARLGRRKEEPDA